MAEDGNGDLVVPVSCYGLEPEESFHREEVKDLLADDVTERGPQNSKNLIHLGLQQSAAPDLPSRSPVIHARQKFRMSHREEWDLLILIGVEAEVSR